MSSGGGTVVLEFGHRLRLPRALSALPLSPLVGRYQELVAQQRVLRLRHIGEALVTSGGRLRVLDGVHVSRAPRGWQRVNGAWLRWSAAENPAAGPLLRQLARLYGRDPMALRRQLERNFAEWSFFGLSALGSPPPAQAPSDPSKSGPQPLRVEDPLLWLLGRLGLIPVSKPGKPGKLAARGARA